MAPASSKSIRGQANASKSPVRPTKLPAAGSSTHQAPAPIKVKPLGAFYLLFATHVLAAVYSPIQDCDEVFNYWEPTHYLNHGHGFQTWEYSPEYGLRSWMYAGIHAVIGLAARLVPFVTRPKVAQFYFIRIALAFVCALCETRLFNKITTALNARVAVLYLMISISAPGLYHASVAYLPSSFAMYTTMLGIAAFMDWRGGLRTSQGIACFGIGACLGWPFVVAMLVPFLLEEAFLGLLSDSQGLVELALRVVYGTVRTIIALLVQFFIDWFFYKKPYVVPFNLVRYNVFSSKGPELYGTEPWHFYVRNLFLNFHVWFLLALVSTPLLLAQHYFRAKGATKISYVRGIVFQAPFYLWLAIFSLQPHKEERFMYPAYPALILNAAMSMHIVLANIGSTDKRDLVAKIPAQLRFFAVLSFVATATAFAAFRTVGTITAYGAPLSIYQPLHSPGMARSGNTVCLGKEWYRFPSHYLLPDGVRAKFIKSEFTGLLPGQFSEAGVGFGMFPGAWLVPPGMNDENREDVGKYTDLKHCKLLVDLQLPSTKATKLEPSYINDDLNWEKVKCLPYLDAASTGVIGRLGWVPDLPFIPERYKRVWGEYCLLKRRRRQVADEYKMPVPNIETML